ncbi:hypothetical protein CsSME_00040640 [Camellia sinensis var. sinensis]
MIQQWVLQVPTLFLINCIPVVVRNESLVDELKEALADVEDKLEFIASEQGAIEVSLSIARHPDAITVP